MKQIIKKFNNLVKETILKVQNKTNNNFNISNFSKYLISFIIVIINKENSDWQPPIAAHIG